MSMKNSSDNNNNNVSNDELGGLINRFDIIFRLLLYFFVLNG